MHIYKAELRLLEHTFFASREVGTLYESEPFIGNYALSYALGLCQAPYRLSAEASGPSYRQDLAVLNEAGLYLTPAYFDQLRMALTQFNSLSDTYFFRFDNNAVGVQRLEETGGRKARANNFPQAGRIRMLGLNSRGAFYLLDRDHLIARNSRPRLLPYIRLGKFMSKAHLAWSGPFTAQTTEKDRAEVNGLLNAADVPDTTKLLVYSVYNVHPAPILRDVEMRGSFWTFRQPDSSGHQQETFLPAGLQYGVE